MRYNKHAFLCWFLLFIIFFVDLSIATAFDEHVDIESWKMNQMILSDLVIDLDDDGYAERLIVYFSTDFPDFDEEDEDMSLGNTSSKYAFNGKVLRLAIFTHLNEMPMKCADIIIETVFPLTYSYIRLSVWGDEQKYIYVHSAVKPRNGIYVTYGVLKYENGELTCVLAMTDPGFTDAWGLYKVEESDPMKLFNVSYYGGDALDVDFPKGAVITDESLDVFKSGEPSFRNSNYQKVLHEQLLPFGINERMDENEAYCTPVCSIKFLTEMTGDDMTSLDCVRRSEIIGYTKGN